MYALTTHSLRGPEPSAAASLDLAGLSMLCASQFTEICKECPSSDPHIHPFHTSLLQLASEEGIVTQNATFRLYKRDRR